MLLVTVARKRRVQQSGVAFEGYQYIDPMLAGYVGEEVMIRYDPMFLLIATDPRSFERNQA